VIFKFNGNIYISYIYPSDMKHEKSCGAVVFYTDKSTGSRKYLLILQAKSKVWGFPKGHVADGETEYDTAAREIFEETGLKVEMLNGFRTSLSYKPKPEKHKNVVLFLSRALNNDVTIDAKEILGYAWLSFDEALKRLTFNNSKDILRKADKFISNLH
jgi:bis(5'-nucleosidyl)-tetraphosphatase